LPTRVVVTKKNGDEVAGSVWASPKSRNPGGKVKSREGYQKAGRWALRGKKEKALESPKRTEKAAPDLREYGNGQGEKTHSGQRCK